jgi:hypothetical protein
MNCLICNSKDLLTIDTKVSDFVMARIAPEIKNNYRTKLCFCKQCSFAFYEYRMNEEEVAKLYYHYRDEQYQKLREQFEYGYTKKVNNLLNTDTFALAEQKRVIKKLIDDNGVKNIDIALDYGGNEGRTFFPELGLKEKYVFDISGAKTIDGVINISNYEDIKKHCYNFIMCNMLFEHLSDPVSMLKQLYEFGNKDTFYYIEVPSENPFIKGNKSILKMKAELINNPIYNILRLYKYILTLIYTYVRNPNFDFYKMAKYFFKKRKQPLMAMTEHINFFTIESMKQMIELNGYDVIDIQENSEKGVLGTSLVLSALFKKK